MYRSNPDDQLELRDISAALRRNRILILAGAVLGLGLGLATLVVVDPQYESTAAVVLKEEQSGGSSVLARLSGGVAGILGGGGGGSAIETEVKILTSRTVVGQVVDSLSLQALVLEPAQATSTAIFERARLDGPAIGSEYEFIRVGETYTVKGPGAQGSARQGVPYAVPGGTFTLRVGALPERFEVQFLNRDDVIDAVRRGIRTQESGEYVEISFRSADPATAAAVPNGLLAEYLRRRKTTDRGVNQHRYEFLTAHTDSLALQLSRAEADLRAYQERSGVFDPELVGKADLERAMEIEGILQASDVEINALRGIIQRGGISGLSPHELAAYPTFLNNPAINDILSRLLELETSRLTLLVGRTADDPDVAAVAENIEHLEGRLVSLSREYLSGSMRQRAGWQQEAEKYRTQLEALPQRAQESYRRQREVKRLSETLMALQSELVQARLGTIGEGGEVRQVDAAVPPRKPVFPSAPLSVAGGLLGGIFFGVVAAIGRSRMREGVIEPWEAEAATGAPAARLDSPLPLGFAGLGDHRRVTLVLPVGGADARPVGERLVETAALQGRSSVLALLTETVRTGAPAVERLPVPAAASPEPWNAGESRPAEPDTGRGYAVERLPRSASGTLLPRSGAMLDALEQAHEAVVGVLPTLDQPEAVSAVGAGRPVVIVARSGEVTRAALQETVSVCTQLGAQVVGVVLSPPGNGRRT